MIVEDVDLLFANSAEILSMYRTDSFAAALDIAVPGTYPGTTFGVTADVDTACGPASGPDSVYSFTLSAEQGLADDLAIGEEVALWDTETEQIMATMKVTEKYTIDKAFECEHVFKTTATEHPGVAKVVAQADVNLAGVSVDRYEVLDDGVRSQDKFGVRRVLS